MKARYCLLFMTHTTRYLLRSLVSGIKVGSDIQDLYTPGQSLIQRSSLPHALTTWVSFADIAREMDLMTCSKSLFERVPNATYIKGSAVNLHKDDKSISRFLVPMEFEAKLLPTLKYRRFRR